MPVEVGVVSGSITQVPADGLITAINASGLWMGGIDRAIQTCAGNLFHGQVAAEDLRDGQVFIASTGSGWDGRFANVVFVIDELKQPLSFLVYNALRTADDAGLKSVTLPTIRTGVMAGAFEPTVDAALEQLVEGIKQFIYSGARSITQISVVVFLDKYSEHKLNDLLVETGISDKYF